SWYCRGRRVCGRARQGRNTGRVRSLRSPDRPGLRHRHPKKPPHSKSRRQVTSRRANPLRATGYNRYNVSGKTFYLETFGCQMNVHDSEKVVGTLVAQGYSQVDTPDEAGLVLYNTCSIRDKAEQKVFNRLQNFKKAAGKDKIFGVLGCVAQQEGE